MKATWHPFLREGPLSLSSSRPLISTLQSAREAWDWGAGELRQREDGSRAESWPTVCEREGGSDQHSRGFGPCGAVQSRSRTRRVGQSQLARSGLPSHRFVFLYRPGGLTPNTARRWALRFFSLSSSSRKGPEVYVTTHWDVCIFILLPSMEWMAFFVGILSIGDLRGQRRINAPLPPPTVLKELGSKRPLQTPYRCPGQVAAHAGHRWGWPESTDWYGNHCDSQLCGSPPCHLVWTTHSPVTWENTTELCPPKRMAQTKGCKRNAP